MSSEVSMINVNIIDGDGDGDVTVTLQVDPDTASMGYLFGKLSSYKKRYLYGVSSKFVTEDGQNFYINTYLNPYILPGPQEKYNPSMKKLREIGIVDGANIRFILGDEFTNCTFNESSKKLDKYANYISDNLATTPLSVLLERCGIVEDRHFIKRTEWEQ